MSPTGTVATASFVVRSSTEMVSSYRLVTHAVSPVVSTTTPWGPDPVVMLSVTAALTTQEGLIGFDLGR